MHAKEFHASIKDLHICANNPALEDFVIQNHCLQFLRTYAKNFHVSIKDLRMCANNPALEDFLVQNHSHVRKKNCQVSIKAMLCVYMRK